MRWIVLFLFVGNLGLLGWFVTTGKQSLEVHPVGNTGSSGSIALVSEVEPGQLQASGGPAERRPGGPRSQVQKGSAAGGSAGEGAPSGTANSLCTLVGPFEERYQGEDVAQRLSALQVRARAEEIEMQGQMRYWVYLAPLNSTREAFRRLRELQSEGIDSYVIPKGSLENGISFGIFSEKARAEGLTEELKAQGVAAQYREEPQTYLEHWVVLDGDGAHLAPDFWQQLQLDYPAIEQRQNLCSEIQRAPNG